MKTPALATTLAVALAAAAAATAAPPPGKGKPAPSCKANVSVILTGTLAADGTAAPSSLSVTVTGGNRFARAYRKAAQPTPVAVTTTTKVVRSGASSTAADLKNGDKVNVRARACKADLAHDATPALTAVRVAAHAPSS